MKIYEIKLLSEQFYNDYNISNYPEMEDKQSRPFLVLLVKIDDNTFAIPFRTNIKHKYCYKFTNTNRSTNTYTALDYSKAVIVNDSKYSLLAMIGGLIAPLFTPLGFGDWRISTALITGFTAKESVVSTLTVLLGKTAEISKSFTPFSAFTFLVFSLLYTPCVAAVAAVKREIGTKNAIALAVFQCVIAWGIAFIFRLAGMLFGFV